MSIKSDHPPLTWDRIEQLACAGHDDFEPPLNAQRARQLVESVRERDEDTGRISHCDNCETPIDGDYASASEVCWDCWRAASTTLASVRAALRGTPNVSEALAALASHPDDFGLQAHTPGLAGQPEAPGGRWIISGEGLGVRCEFQPEAQCYCGSTNQLHDVACPADESRAGQPETPKGPAAEEAECCSDPYECWKEFKGELHTAHELGRLANELNARLERDLAAANAEITRLRHETNEQQVSLAAANARIAEVEEQRENYRKTLRRVEREDDAALQSTKAKIAELTESEDKACKLVREIANERDAANARIAELADEARRKDAYYQNQSERIKAANERIAELEQDLKREQQVLKEYATDLFKLKEKSRNRVGITQLDDATQAWLEEAVVDTGAGKFRGADVLTVLDAANARADAADRRSRTYEAANGKLVDDKIQLAQKLEAAEREKKRLSDWFDEYARERDQLVMQIRELEENRDTFLSGHVAELKTERDQLAARLTELETHLSDAPMALCTPEERKVLKEVSALTDAQLEWLGGVSRRVKSAELANRAAKAKRGGA